MWGGSLYRTMAVIISAPCAGQARVVSPAPRNCSRPVSTTGSTSVGACATPGTGTNSPRGSASTMRLACASESTSLSVPHTTLVGQGTAGRDGRHLATVGHRVLQRRELLWPAPHNLGDPLAAPFYVWSDVVDDQAYERLRVRFSVGHRDDA